MLIIVPALSFIVGVVVAVLIRLMAWRMRLPRWDDFLADKPESEPDW